MKTKSVVCFIAAVICNVLFMMSSAWAQGCANEAGSTPNILIASSVNPTSPMTSEAKNNPIDEAERRGCCSHRQGVCGCSSGRAICCDGTPSPSCGCN